MTNTNKKAAPSPKSTAINTNAPKCSTCGCSAQMILDGFPQPPEREEGPLVDFLEARPAWWSRAYLCGCLGMDERSLRLQAEHSNGRVIFSSSNGGLRATRHADEMEILACAAELRNRAASHTRRADEVERMGGLVHE